LNSKAIKEYAADWVTKNEKWISDFDQKIWHLAEPALREYESAAAYVEVLRKEGFTCLLYTSPSPRDRTRSRMPSSA